MNPQTRRHTRILAALAAAAAAIALAGCGGDDDSGDGDAGSTDTSAQAPDPASISPEQRAFITKADKICSEGDAKIDKGGQAFAGTSNKVDQLVTTVIVPGTREEIEQLRALEPPAGDSDQVNEFIDTLEEGMDQLEETPSDLAGGPALQTIIDARALAFEYGLVDCARS